MHTFWPFVVSRLAAFVACFHQQKKQRTSCTISPSIIHQKNKGGVLKQTEPLSLSCFFQNFAYLLLSQVHCLCFLSFSIRKLVTTQPPSLIHFSRGKKSYLSEIGRGKNKGRSVAWFLFSYPLCGWFGNSAFWRGEIGQFLRECG